MSKNYLLYGIDTAVNILRPGATWEITDNKFTLWDDPRPCPSIEEVFDTMNKIKELEDSINIIFLPEQLEKFREFEEKITG